VKDLPELVASGAGKMSGDGYEHLREGWALFPFRGERGHWWREITNELPDEFPRIGKMGARRYYESACRPRLVAMATAQVPALRLGNFDACKRCLRLAPRPPNADDGARLSRSGDYR
jgi:hypothetical protein